MGHFIRKYNHPKFRENEGIFIPYLDKNNEERAEKIKKRSNNVKYYDSWSEFRDGDLELVEFLEDKTHFDSFQVSDDLTEEQLDQALFEASYAKPDFESDEFKGK